MDRPAVPVKPNSEFRSQQRKYHIWIMLVNSQNSMGLASASRDGDEAHEEAPCALAPSTLLVRLHTAPPHEICECSCMCECVCAHVRVCVGCACECVGYVQVSMCGMSACTGVCTHIHMDGYTQIHT